MVDVLLLKLLELPLADLFVRHEDIVTDFHEAATVAVRMAKFAKFRIVRRAKVVEHLAIRATRVTNWRGLRAAIAAPPVFAAVVEEDARTILHTFGRTVFLTTDILHRIAQSGIREESCPYISCFSVFRDAVAVITDVARNVEFAQIKSDNIAVKFKHPLDLLLLEVVTHAPVAEHLKKGRMAIVTDVIDILRTEARLRIHDPLTLWMRFAEEIWDHRLHARACEKCRRIARQDKWGTWHDFVTTIFIKFEVSVADFLSVHICCSIAQDCFYMKSMV